MIPAIKVRGFDATTNVCPGCRAVLSREGGPTHPYYGCSPECWARYGEVLAREYHDPRYFATRQLTVDAYAVQHPGVPERRTIQSVAIHLMTLAMILDGRLDPRDGPTLHKRMVSRPAFHWLEPPSMEGRMTVVDVLPASTPPEHERLVCAWAEDVWLAWSPHHGVVHRWLEQSLDDTEAGPTGGGQRHHG